MGKKSMSKLKMKEPTKKQMVVVINMNQKWCMYGTKVLQFHIIFTHFHWDTHVSA